jgi:hypothetical protein
VQVFDVISSEWGIGQDEVKKMTRRELDEAVAAISERRGGYQNKRVTTNITDEQEEKINKLIKERFNNVKNND